MSQYQFTYISLPRNPRGLQRSSMARIIGHLLQIVQESGLMIKHVYPINYRYYAFKITRIAAEGIAHGFTGFQGQFFILKYITVTQRKIFTQFQIMVIADFNFRILGDFRHIQMSVLRLFAEKVAVTVNSMIQWDCKNLQTVVLIYFNRNLTFQLVVYDFKTSVRLRDAEDGFQHLLYAFGSINVDRRFPAEQPE